MKYVIYGAGAVGLVGARLARAGIEVVLLGRPAHVAAVGATWLKTKSGTEVTPAPASAKSTGRISFATGR